MPGRVCGELWIDAGRHEAEVRRRDLPFARIAIGVAKRLELFQVCHLAHIDLCGQVLSNRLLERLAGLEVATRK